jgi:hypothetical protein
MINCSFAYIDVRSHMKRFSVMNPIRLCQQVTSNSYIYWKINRKPLMTNIVLQTVKSHKVMTNV